MVSLVKDPNGENIFTQGDTTLTASMNSRRRIGVVDGEQADGSKVKQLETKIVQLEAELEHQKVCWGPFFNRFASDIQIYLLSKMMKELRFLTTLNPHMAHSSQ